MPGRHANGDYQQNARRALRREILWLDGFILLLAVSMFLPAGRLGWVQGRVFLGTYLARMLHNELAGYKEYANRVRYWLVPGIW